MALQMQACLGSPIVGLGNGSRMTQMILPSKLVPRLEKRVGLKVRCMAEEAKEEPNVDSSGTNSSTPTSAMSSPTTLDSQPTPKPQKKANTSIGDVFAFSGPGPERINGRLAMVGFVAAIAVEVFKGGDLFTQISNGGAIWFLGTSILLSVASLVPLLQGESAESKKEGLMNAEAELWNGRAAMLGLLALAFTEYLKGGALV